MGNGKTCQKKQHGDVEFHKVPKCCVRQGTVRVGKMTNRWMGMGVLDGGWVSWAGVVSWTGVGGTGVPLSVGLDGMGYINPMDDSIVPSPLYLLIHMNDAPTG
jgi:hypothetical protein